MLRRDPRIRWIKVGHYFFKGWTLDVPSRRPVKLVRERIPLNEMDGFLARQGNEPILCAVDIDRAAKLWIFRRQFYWEDEGYSAAQLRALLLDQEERRTRKVERAQSRLETRSAMDQPEGREPIPDDVKIFVWKRDAGRCVKCGSQRDLEFDHIIPVSMGGSNSARNLQLLCEPCNRSKGGGLV